MSWFKFTADYDHRWPSGAVTEFKEGMILSVKQEVAEAAKAAGAGKPTTKPKDGEPGYKATPTGEESQRLPRGAVRHVKAGGHAYPQTGNPLLPDPADPAALRSEPMVERGRARTMPQQPDAEPEVEESESQIDAVKPD